MSKQLINQYYNQMHQAKRMGATTEGALSPYFHQLISQYAQSRKYLFLREITIKSTKTNKNIRPDGILMNDLRVHRGYWESKDTQDDLDVEINKKIHNDGYPSNNILFEDTKTAVLIQGGVEVMRCAVNDADKLHDILNEFVNYRPAEVLEFEAALEEFKKDIPEIVQTFRDLFDNESKINKKYVTARDRFLELCKTEINPDITEADIREMLIQHILTEDLFTAIFDDASFLKYNIIARELESLINTVITREVRQNQLGDIRHYYQTLNATAAQIADHNEKQKFLKIVYENFYKVYNPKGADRLGVVYTPNEIVRFMVESTDYLLDKHFNKNLHDKGVEILDPATGTGTFITDIIDYIPPQYLKYKYENELHANEVSILPYYIANLNIEYTYQNKMDSYAEFKNICFVDTLDNTDGLSYKGKQQSLFGLSSENSERIKRQNDRKISVIIGNPPYNANQLNFNDFNSNRAYPLIDKRIKNTFVKYSKATNKANVYDMYTRFYRWAMDRVGAKGVIAFITNRSLIDSMAFDGFRQNIATEFDHIYIVDLGGDVRQNPKLSGTKNNVFGIQTGVAIAFLVKTPDNKIEVTDKEEFDYLKKTLKLKKQVVSEPEVHYGNEVYLSDKGCRIWYIRRPEEDSAEQKLDFLNTNTLEKLLKQGAFERVKSQKNNWINLTDNDFDTFLPIISKETKAGKDEKAIFKLYSLGVASHRDSWVYDFSKDELSKKMRYFTDIYNKTVKKENFEDKNTIAWDHDLQKYLERKILKKFNKKQICVSQYRPFSKRYHYYDQHFNARLYQWNSIWNNEKDISIGFSGLGFSKNFQTLCTNKIPCLDTVEKGQWYALYRYDEHGNRHDNLTDWGLSQFTEHYKDDSITKEAIFHYTYAVLHHPAYRKKYALNLKREFPRLPFYKDFWQWSNKGKELMDLHLNYETVEPFALKRVDKDEPKKAQAALFENQSAGDLKSLADLTQRKLKVKLKADKEKGIIYIDEHTHLEGVPKIAWTYKLGNRSALEWILDQYKEKKPKDKTIAEKFDTYRFADYKETVIDLLMRVCTVSVRTVELIIDN